MQPICNINIVEKLSATIKKPRDVICITVFHLDSLVTRRVSFVLKKKSLNPETKISLHRITIAGKTISYSRNSYMFFSYNNGLSATADGIEIKQLESGLELVRADNLQIVNGGQTTASLHAAKKLFEEKKYDPY